MEIIYFLFLSCVGLLASAQAQNCSKPVLGPNIELKGNNILKESFTNGTRVRLTCSIGHTAVSGSPFITCNEGTWSPVSLKCGRKSCGALEELPNGDIKYNGNEFGDSATYICKPGYILVGRATCRCEDQGWDCRVPKCEVVTCDPPPAIASGSYYPVEEVYDYREVIEYSCNGGLTLIGSTTSSCSDDGQFNPSAPQCKRVECPDFEIENGVWSGGSRPPHGYQATLTFSCNLGYKFQGHASVTCGSDNNWSLEPPVCEVVTCQRPSEVAHGSFSPNKTIYQYSNAIQYTCDEGYRINGRASRSCSQSGTFTPDSPTCIMVTCQRPSEEGHGSFSPDQITYQYNDVIKYSCDKGYKMIESDSPTRTCGQSGTFTPAPPRCSPQDCSKPVPGENMDLIDIYESFPHGSSVKFKCNTGYHAAGGSSSITCTAGSWSRVTLRCERITTTQRPTTTTNGATPDDKENSGSNVGLVIGLLLGVLVLLFAVICGYRYLKKKNSAHRSADVDNAKPVDMTLLKQQEEL